VLTDSGPAAPAPLDPEIVRRIAERVVSDVADMPRFSPEDQPDMMLVTADELRDFVEDAVREFLGAVQAERPREPSVEALDAFCASQYPWWNEPRQESDTDQTWANVQKNKAALRAEALPHLRAAYRVDAGTNPQETKP